MLKNTIKSIPYHFVIVLICFTINFTDGFDLIAMAVTAPIISEALNIESTSLGMVFSSALLGMTFGAILLAPLSDKIGRRKIILFSILIISFSMILTAYVSSFYQLIVLRFTSGLGIGGILASSTSVVSEFVPRKYLASSVIFCATGFTLGTIIVGPAAVYIIKYFGWQYMFIFGGSFGLLTFFIVFFYLPESISFLLSSSRNDNKKLSQLNKTLNLLGRPPLNSIENPDNIKEKEIINKKSWPLLNTDNKKTTLVLWGLFFFSYWASYFLINWIPQLFVLEGKDLELSIHALTFLTLGGLFGAWLLAIFSTRYNLKSLIAFMLLITTILIGSYSAIKPQNPYIIYSFMLLIGFTLNGSLTALYAIAAGQYPIEIRSTGVGWGIGIGRIGAIISPIVAGVLLDFGFGIYEMFLIIALPAVIIATYLAFKNSYQSKSLSKDKIQS